MLSNGIDFIKIYTNLCTVLYMTITNNQLITCALNDLNKKGTQQIILFGDPRICK